MNYCYVSLNDLHEHNPHKMFLMIAQKQTMSNNGVSIKVIAMQIWFSVD